MIKRSDIEKMLYDLNIDIDDGDEEFIENGLLLIANKISVAIFRCSKCEDDQRRRVEGEEFGMRFGGEDVCDFLEQYRMKVDEGSFEPIRKELMKRIKCQNCKFGGTRSKDSEDVFDEYDFVYTKEGVDDFYGINQEILERLYQEYGFKFEISEIDEFEEFIIEKPMMAMKHGVGIKFYNLLKAIHEKDESDEIKKGTVLFRGRTRKKSESRLTPEKMWEPPYGIASHGRYNLTGLPVLYCLDEISGIPIEVPYGSEEELDVATLVLEDNLKVFDMEKIFCGFNAFSRVDYEKIESSSKIKKIYWLTNFIKDCCHEIGYRGIKYAGVNYAAQHNNYAFFSGYKKDNEIKIEKVETFKNNPNKGKLRWKLIKKG